MFTKSKAQVHTEAVQCLIQGAFRVGKLAEQYKGKFVIALLPADGATPMHFENTKGEIALTLLVDFEQCKVQMYTSAKRAQRAVDDFAENYTVPTGYTLAVVSVEQWATEKVAEYYGVSRATVANACHRD